MKEFTLTAPMEFRQEIKRSRFIALAEPVESVEQAMKFFEVKSDATARHNCWAYKVGRDYRFNDDGEPSGTAGKPILAAIEYAELTNVAVLVIRWFGGIKLGTGGLARAYGGSASSCLNLAEKTEIKPTCICRLEMPFALTGLVHQLIGDERIVKLSEVFNAEGICLRLQIEESFFADFERDVRNATGGRVEVTLVEA